MNGEAAAGVGRRLWYAYAFNFALDDYDILGLFNTKARAQAALAAHPGDPRGKVAILQTWREASGHLTPAQLGRLTKAAAEFNERHHAQS